MDEGGWWFVRTYTNTEEAEEYAQTRARRRQRQQKEERIMSNSVSRYLAAAKLAGKHRNTFNSHFIGCLSASFDYNLTEGAWDEALNRAIEHVAGLEA